MKNIDATVTIKLDEFLKVLDRAKLFDEIVETAKMVNPFGENEPWIMFKTEFVLKEKSPEIFAELTKRCRAEWEQKKNEMEESA